MARVSAKRMRERAVARAYYARNREKFLKYQHDRWERNPQKARAYQRAYRKKNHEKTLVWGRRANKKNMKRLHALGLTQKGTPKLSGWERRRINQKVGRDWQASMTSAQRTRLARKAARAMLKKETPQRRKERLDANRRIWMKQAHDKRRLKELLGANIRQFKS